MMTQLTVIIPHYNATNSLPKLLQTIPEAASVQTIVIDDYSDEDHQLKLTKLRETVNFELVYNTSGKKGAGVCRNIGLKRAKGKWLLFADADDFFIDNAYEVLQTFFHSNTDIVFFRPTSIEADTGDVSTRHLPFTKLITDSINAPDSRRNELSLRYKFIVPWSKLMRRSFVHEHGILFDEVMAANDIMFSTKVGWYLRNYEVSDDVIYCATTHKGSLTMTLNQAAFNTRLNVFIRQHQFLKTHLSKADFKMLGLSGRPLVIKAADLGWRQFFSALFTLKYHKVRMLETQLLNPVRFFEKAASLYKRQKRERPYYINK